MREILIYTGDRQKIELNDRFIKGLKNTYTITKEQPFMVEDETDIKLLKLLKERILMKIGGCVDCGTGTLTKNVNVIYSWGEFLSAHRGMTLEKKEREIRTWLDMYEKS